MFRNLEKQVLEFEYDTYYKKMGELIKEISDTDKFFYERKIRRKEIENLLSVDKNLINIDDLKKNFADIILDENSSQILWLLDSIYIDEECNISYLDTVSNIFEKSNQVVRKGINTYKANGWMTHTLYVYQIINENIAKNIIPNNFKKDIKKYNFIKECFNELHKEYIKFDDTLKFILRITALIHDIGVVESVRDHGYHGQKFVEDILKDIGITQEFLLKNNIKISLENLQILEKAILKEHTIYTGVSSEFSDYFVEQEYRKFLENVDIAKLDKKQITSILYMFTVADVIGVNECIFDEQKIKLLKEAKKFFYEIIDNKEHDRNREKVAVERICDFIGIYDTEKIKIQSEEIMKKFNINSELFWNRLYNAGQFWFFLSIMKEIGTNFENVIRTLDSIFDVTAVRFDEEKIKTLSVVWIPNNNQKQAVKNIEDGTFFEAMNFFKASKEKRVELGKNRLSIYEKDNRIHFEIEIL